MIAARVEGLTKIYPAHGGRPVVRAVDDVSFRIGKGETLGLVGASGCGKTTLGRTMLRLVEPSAGSIEISTSDGQLVDLLGLGPRDLRNFRRHAQMVFQDPVASLNPRLTVREALEEPLEVHGIGGYDEQARRVRELAEQVGLDARLLDERPGSLSGGQRQRVGIARAIAVGPSLIVADEPVTALDVSVQAQILNLLREIQAELGLSYLFISHDLAVVEQMADRITVMARGCLVESGSAGELLAAAQHAESRRLVQAAREASLGKGGRSPDGTIPM